MAGLVTDHTHQGRIREASQLASEAWAPIEPLGDPTLTVGLSAAVIYAKIESAEWRDVLRRSQRVIDLADGVLSKGNFLFGSSVSGRLCDAGYFPLFPGSSLRDVMLLRAAGSTGTGARRRDCLRATPGSLPRHGENARLRGTYRLGPGDAMTATGKGRIFPDNLPHSARARPAYPRVGMASKCSAPRRCRANRNGCSRAGIPT
jgi:hypothetical protein